MKKQGMHTKAIAEQLGITIHQVQWRVLTARERGELGFAKEYRPRPKRTKNAFAAYRKQYGIDTGTFGMVGDLLSMSQLEWLYKITPSGLTIAETVSAIIKDAYSEENE